MKLVSHGFSSLGRLFKNPENYLGSGFWSLLEVWKCEPNVRTKSAEYILVMFAMFMTMEFSESRAPRGSQRRDFWSLLILRVPSFFLYAADPLTEAPIFSEFSLK